MGHRSTLKGPNFLPSHTKEVASNKSESMKRLNQLPVSDAIVNVRLSARSIAKPMDNHFTLRPACKLLALLQVGSQMKSCPHNQASWTSPQKEIMPACAAEHMLRLFSSCATTAEVFWHSHKRAESHRNVCFVQTHATPPYPDWCHGRVTTDRMTSTNTLYSSMVCRLLQLFLSDAQAL